MVKPWEGAFRVAVFSAVGSTYISQGWFDASASWWTAFAGLFLLSAVAFMLFRGEG